MPQAPASSSCSCARPRRRASEAERAVAGDLMKTTLSEVGSSFSEISRTPEEIHAYADALADMLGAYLARLASGPD